MIDEVTLEKVVEFMEKHIPFNAFLGIRVPRAGGGFARLELSYRKEFIGDPYRPALHGGVVSTMIDTCGGCAVYTAANPMDRVSTVDLRVDYIRPGPLKDIACEGTVVRLGNLVGVTDMKLFAIDEPQRIIATGKGVYNIRHLDQDEPSFKSYVVD